MTPAAEAVSAAAKTCRRCGETKPVADMKRDPRYVGGYSPYCRLCHQAASVAWQKANPERLNHTRRLRHARNSATINAQRRAEYDPAHVRTLNLWRFYRVTPERYAAMLADQGAACAICRRPAADFARALSVDHDHACCIGPPTCGKCTRGLLCSGCNLSLHSIERSQQWLTAAAAYLVGKP